MGQSLIMVQRLGLLRPCQEQLVLTSGERYVLLVSTKQLEISIYFYLEAKPGRNLVEILEPPGQIEDLKKSLTIDLLCIGTMPFEPARLHYSVSNRFYGRYWGFYVNY